MFPGETTQNQPTAADRETSFTRATALLGPDADTEQVMRVAEWLHSGGPILDPDRLKAAARACAAQDTAYDGSPVDYDNLSPNKQAHFDGRAAQVVLAYLQGR
ncbi:MAG TPA: hypothetical protein VGL02_27340 [Streptomyces sp.]